MTHAAFSLQGASRSRNKDAYYIDETSTCFIVAEGLGGHPSGDVASAMAVEFVIESILAQRLRRCPVTTVSVASDILNTAFRDANDRLIQFTERFDCCCGMASTVVAAIMSRECAYVAGVGDSRGYLLRSNRLQRLTLDDRLPNETFTSGLMTKSDANGQPSRHLVTRYIGADPLDSQSETRCVQLCPGDRMLLCTDGLYNALSESELSRILQSSEDAHHAVNKFRSRLKVAPATDDATAIVIFAGKRLRLTQPVNRIEQRLGTRLNGLAQCTPVRRSLTRTPLRGHRLKFLEPVEKIIGCWRGSLQDVPLRALEW